MSTTAEGFERKDYGEFFAFLAYFSYFEKIRRDL
jgi:hypothetical protein